MALGWVKGGNVQLRTSCKDRQRGGKKNSPADANNEGGRRRYSGLRRGVMRS